MTGHLPARFLLADEIERLIPGTAESGRRAETLVKTDHLRVVLVTMRPGTTLHDHTAPGPITIQAIRGHFTVSSEGTTLDLPAGALVAIEADTVHAVESTTDGAFLLTISWPASAARADRSSGHDDEDRRHDREP